MSKILEIAERASIYAYSQDDILYLLGVIDRVREVALEYRNLNVNMAGTGTFDDGVYAAMSDVLERLEE